MRRGEVWWAELAADAGFRPVVIVSRSAGLDQRANVTVAEVTESFVTFRARSRSMSQTACVVNTDNLHTIPRERLRERITTAPEDRIFSLTQALRHSLDLE